MNPIFVKNMSAYPNTPMTIKDFMPGIVHPRHEILALLPVLKLTGKSSATTFNLGDADLDLLVASFVAKERATWMGLTDAVNAVPDITRDFAQYGLGGDAWQMQLITRTGQAVPATGGTANVYNIPLAIPYMNIQKENRNQNAFSAGQLYTGAEINLDLVAAPPALPATIVLPGGSIVISAVSAEIWVLCGAIRPYLWMAPASKIFTRPVNGIQYETEGGPLFDEIVMTVLDAATYPNAGDAVAIQIDGKTYLPPTPIGNLPFGFAAATLANENVLPSYDISQNTKARAAAARTGRVPLIYLNGIENPIERELNGAVLSTRSINFGTKTTAAGTLAFWRQTPFTSQENLAHLTTMMMDPRLSNYFVEAQLTTEQIDAIRKLNFADLAIAGGGSSGPGAMNSDLSLFKPRMFVPRRD